MIWIKKIIGIDYFKQSLIIYHLIFPFICWYYTINNPKESDSERYIRFATDLDWRSLFDFGDRFIALLIYPFVKIGFGYLTLTLLFSAISLIGFLTYYNLYKQKGYLNLTNSNFLAVFWLFLPSLHFWSSFLGKDAIVFVMLALVLKAIDSKYYKSPLLFLFVVLAFFIRPYSVLIVLLALVISILSFAKIKLKKKIAIALGMFVVLITTTLVLVRFYLNIDSAYTIKAILSQFYNNLQSYQEATGATEYSVLSTSYLEKLSIIAFRPLYFDANSFFQILASVQNTVIIATIVYYGYLFFAKKRRLNNISYKFALIAGLLFLIIIGSYIYNLGQASRMRVMILPFILYALSNLSSNNKKTIH